MKIALLSTNYDLGGAAVVTLRLAEALHALGHDACMVVARPGNAAKDDEGVICVDKLRWSVPFLAERAELFLKGVARRDLFKLSTGRYGVRLEEIPFVREADLIIVGWASQGFLSLDSLERILSWGKPVIYMMHDLWPATALCHLPGDCRGYCDGRECYPCPLFAKGKGERLIREIAMRKGAIFGAENLRLTAVSSWQRDMALRSFILQGKEIEVIPHPFPVEEYIPGVKVNEKGERRIVMAAARLDDEVKDLPAAVEAINILDMDYPDLTRGLTVDFVGELRDRSVVKRLRVPYNLHGLLRPEALREIYAGATAVISSSKYETMGATLMEGMAAGAIPVTYGDAGQTDIVTDGVNGFIAPTHTPASLSFALRCALETARDLDNDPDSGFTPGRLHEDVARRFSPEVIARRILALAGR